MHPLSVIKSSRKPLVLALLLFCIPATFAALRRADSMVYDDIVRDVPRTLRFAHDKPSALLDLVHHAQSMSVTNRMEELLRQHKDGDDSFVSSLRGPTYTSLGDNMTATRVTTAAPAISSLCRQHVAAIFEGIFHGQLWAIELIDSWGKPRPGVLEAHIRSYGDYYECRNVKGHQLMDGINITVKGKYCLTTLSVFEENNIGIDVSLQEGICVPDVCSQGEVTLLLEEVLQKYNLSDKLPQKQVVCHQDQSMDGTAIFGLTFFLFLVIIALAATVVDNRYPKAMPQPWSDREKEGERNGRTPAAINRNHSHAHPSSNHVISSEYQPLSPFQATSSRIREKFSTQILLCFSLKTNFLKLVDTTGKEDAMGCIHGLRFFTISWIIIGHTILLITKRAENAASFGKQIVPNAIYQVFINCTFACDSFLCFSGILVCYNLMHTLKYFKGKMRWHLFYIYRYLRLTPAMAVVMMLYSTTFPYWYDGPIWMQGGVEPQRCSTTWWHNLLYINNFFHNQCMGWLWYLAVDTQLYAISPIFVAVLYRKPRIGVYFLLVALAVSIAVTAAVSYSIQLRPSSFTVLADNMQTLGDPMVEYYYAPYCRMPPYLIGMLAGYLLYVKDRKMNIPKIWQVIGWSIVVPTTSLTVFGLYKACLFQTDLVPMTLAQAVLYNTLTRPAWGASVAWIIVLCVTGHGGFLNSVLSWKPLIPLARATYMAYMIHVIIILWLVLSSQTPMVLGDPSLFVYFLGFIFMTYLVAFPASLLVEAPVMSLQRLLLKQHSAKAKPGTNAQDQGED